MAAALLAPPSVVSADDTGGGDAGGESTSSSAESTDAGGESTAAGGESTAAGGEATPTNADDGSSWVLGDEGHAACVLGDGRILVAGGDGGAGMPIADAQVYDPATDTYTLVGPMQLPRTYHSATLLADGRVLIAGGTDGYETLGALEVFDPVTGTFSLLGSSLAVPRQEHQADALSDGRVLIRGGSSLEQGEGLETLEAYDPGTDAIAVLTSTEGLIQPTLSTDKEDYLPGDYVVVTGSGWVPGETVSLLFDEDPLEHIPRVLTAVADGDGNLYNADYLVEEHDLGTRFTLVGQGADAHWSAQTTFTDGSALTLSNLKFSSPSGATDGTFDTSQTVTVQVTVTNRTIAGGLSNPSFTGVSATLSLPSGWSLLSTSPGASSLSAGASTTWSWSVRSSSSTGPAVLGVSASGTPSSGVCGALSIVCSDNESVTAALVNPASLSISSQSASSTLMKGGAGFTFSTTVANGSPPRATANGVSVALSASSTGTAAMSCTSSSGASAISPGASVSYGHSCTASGTGTLAITSSATGTDENTGGSVSATKSYGSTLTVDSAAPVLTVPADMVKEATSTAGAVVTWTTSTSDFTAVATSCSPASGSTFSKGAHTVSCTATDAVGNSTTDTFSVTVVDTTAPSISGVPADKTVEATSASGAAVTFVTPTASDIADGSVAVTCSPASGTTFPLGVTPVSCTATDASGNSSSTGFSATVVDTTAPSLAALPADQTAEASSPAGAALTYASPTALDAVDSSVQVSCLPASGATFPLGITTVTCAAADDSGNEAEDTFTVTVVDTTAPTFDQTPNNRTVAATSGAGALVSFSSPTASDLVDTSVAVACAPASGQVFALGTTLVTCTAVDDSGNSASTGFSVLVADQSCESPSAEVCDGLDNDCDGATDDADAEETAVVSAFDSSSEGWTVSDAGSGLAFKSSSGNPDGYLAVSDTSEGRAWASAPAGFLGDWSTGEGCGGIRFDHQIFPGSGSGTYEPYEIRITGSLGDTATYTGSNAIPGSWQTVTAPLTGSAWDVTGDWSVLLEDVVRVEIRAELLANSTGSDLEGIDNVVLTIDCNLPLPGSVSWNADDDGDGYGDPATGVEACAAPAGYVGNDTDCDDGDDMTHPGAGELCDGIDNDCDGQLDGGDPDAALESGSWYEDVDGDGYGDPERISQVCDQPDGMVGDAGDCDDGDETVNPEALEVCDSLDNDCDGRVDDADLEVDGAPTWYVDLDDDGFGDALESLEACVQPAGYVVDRTDCDDADEGSYPDADEVCDLVDNDCDGAIDDEDTEPRLIESPFDGSLEDWYLSTTGGKISWASSSGNPGGYMRFDDTSSGRPYVAAPSRYLGDWSTGDGCGSIVFDHRIFPESASGTTSRYEVHLVGSGGQQATWYGATPVAGSWTQVTAPLTASSWTVSGSWSGLLASVSRLEIRIELLSNNSGYDIEGIDNVGVTLNCNTAPLPGSATWYRDDDADGFGTSSNTLLQCAAPAGYALSPGDCNDTDGFISPGADEVCDGVDNDCDGVIDMTSATGEGCS